MGKRVYYQPTKRALLQLNTIIQSSDNKMMTRARIVLRYIENPTATFKSVGLELGCAESRVLKWVRRFRVAGPVGLYDLPREGRPRVAIRDDVIFMKKNLMSRGLPHDQHAIAKALGISHDTVERLLKRKSPIYA